MNTLSKTRDLVLAAVIAAIIVIMAFVPFLGYILCVFTLCYHGTVSRKSGKPGYLPGSKNTDWGCGLLCIPSVYENA